MTKEELLQLESQVRYRLDRELNTSTMGNDELRAAIENIIVRELAGRYLTLNQRLMVVDEVYASYRGFGGLLDIIMQDDSITEVMVNGPKNIFVERDGKLVRYEREFKDEDELVKVIRLIVGKVNKEITVADPIKDARLPDGSRVNAVLSPIALDGATLTIRKFSSKPMTIERLIQYGSITPKIAEFLEKLVCARFNIFVSGGTGSGKTTFLNALSNYIPADERVITIEDSAELQIKNVPNLVRLETRNATSSSDKEITIRDLIKSSLRMRPDRIIVGEVRGGEALDMLQAMNTGHDGSLSTGHANSAKDMLRRLETMVKQGSVDLPLESIRNQIESSVDIIIHLSRLRDRSRKTLTISEVSGFMPNGEVRLNHLFEFRETAQSTNEKVIGNLVRTENPIGERTREKLFRAGFTEKDLI